MSVEGKTGWSSLTAGYEAGCRGHVVTVEIGTLCKGHAKEVGRDVGGVGDANIPDDVIGP